MSWTWSGKKVLVTGAGGFIGSHLVEALVAGGASVRALFHYNSQGSLGWLQDSTLLRDFEAVHGDIRDSEICHRVMSGMGSVFHLAALIAIPYSYEAAHSYVETNIRGTLNLCEAAKRAEVARFVHTSTSEVYGTAISVPISENHPLQPQSPYSASKIGADSIALSYYHSFRLPLSIARPFNTFGPRQSARAVIPAIITQLLRSKTLSLGSLHPPRDFNFVLDTVSGLMAIGASELCVGNVTNIGSGFEISIADLTLEIAQILGMSSLSTQIDERRIRPEGSEVNRLLADNRRIRENTNWVPAYSGLTGLREGLRQTVNWLQSPENLSRYREGYAV